jgi:hypothetical protein
MDITSIFSQEQLANLDMAFAHLPMDNMANIADQLISVYFTIYATTLSVCEAVIYLLWKCPEEWRYAF